MQKKRIHSKISYYFARLPQSELRRFLDFVESPFFNKKRAKNVIFLAKIYFSRMRKWEPDSSEWKTLLAESPIELSNLTRTKSRLLQLFWKFCEHQGFEQKSEHRLNYVLEYFQSQKTMKHFDYFYNKAVLICDENEANVQVLEYWKEIEFAKTKSLAEQPQRTGDKNLTETIMSLDKAYLARRLHLEMALNNQRRLVETSLQEIYPLDYEGMTSHLNFDKNVYISLLREVHAAGSDRANSFQVDGKRFHEAKKMLLDNHFRLAREDAKDMFKILLNLCFTSIKSGKGQYLQEALNIYQEMENFGLLLEEDGKILPHNYKNIVKIAIRLKDYDYCRTFILDFHDKLPKAQMEAYYHFCQAVLVFEANEDYVLAYKNMEYVKKAKSSAADAFLQMEARLIQIKAVVELSKKEIESNDEVERICQAFRMYASRDSTLSENEQAQYLNFIQTLQKFWRIVQKPTIDQERLAILKAEVNNAITVAEKRWLD